MKSQAEKQLKYKYYHDLLYNKLPKYYAKLKKNSKNLRSYFQLKRFIQKQYYFKLRDYDSQLVDYKGELKAMRIIDKKFSITYNNKIFETVKKYDYKQDPDFYLCNGNEEQFIKRKMLRAEEKLIKGRVLYKLSRDMQ